MVLKAGFVDICRTRDSLAVSGQAAALRFYAGAPLLSSDGQLLGTL